MITYEYPDHWRSAELPIKVLRDGKDGPGGTMTDTERITNEVYDRYVADPLYAPIDEDPMAPAIGLRNGLILAIIFWAGVALCFFPWGCK